MATHYSRYKTETTSENTIVNLLFVYTDIHVTVRPYRTDQIHQLSDDAITAESASASQTAPKWNEWLSPFEGSLTRNPLYSKKWAGSRGLRIKANRQNQSVHSSLDRRSLARIPVFDWELSKQADPYILTTVLPLNKLITVEAGKLFLDLDHDRLSRCVWIFMAPVLFEQLRHSLGAGLRSVEKSTGKSPSNWLFISLWINLTSSRLVGAATLHRIKWVQHP